MNGILIAVIQTLCMITVCHNKLQSKCSIGGQVHLR